MSAKEFQYTEAKLYPTNPTIEDLGKRWAIMFRVWHVQENRLVKRNDYNINKIVDEDPELCLERRLKFAKKRIKGINDLLKSGYHIDVEKKKKIDLEKRTWTILDAIDEALKIARGQLDSDSYNSYSSTASIFKTFLKKKKYSSMSAALFEAKHVLKFVDERRAAGISARTVNNNIGFLSALMGYLVDRDNPISENPFSGIKKQKQVESERNLAFSQEEIQELKGVISGEDPRLWSFIQIMFYTFARPNEIRQFTVKMIRLQENRIYIPASVSKNKKSEYVTIPYPLVPTLIALTEHKKQRDFLFPGKNPGTCISKNRMNDYFRPFRDELGYSEQHTLYSWKHTGVCTAYRSGVDIKSIQLQCRHHSIAQTDDYLRSLGLYENLAIKMKMPEI